MTGFSVYLARQFISDVPDSICEAAKIGRGRAFSYLLECGSAEYPSGYRFHWNLYRMMQWNDYLNPLLMLNDMEKMTMPLGLVIFNSQRTSDLSATMAAATMIMMPMIIIFVMFQKQFIKGMTMSGIK